MAKASWVGKVPADMDNDELAAAKQAIAEQIPDAQAYINNLSAAAANLDWEINSRFRMSAMLPPVSTLPSYPVDALAEEFGNSGA